VLSASRAPQDSGSPGSITSGSGGNGGLPEFAQSVLTPGGLSTNAAVIGINAALAGFTLLLLVLSSELFNKTVEENHDTLSRWLKPVFGPIESVFRFIGESWNSTTGESAFGMIGGPLAVLALSGLIYGVLEPGFGFNDKSIVMFLSVIITVGVITYFYNGGQIIVSKRLLSAEGAIRLFPIGVLVAALCVLMSRLDGFQPGILYGFIASAVLLGGVEPNEEQDGKIHFYPVLALLGLCVLAWLLVSPLRDLANDNGGWWAALPVTIVVGVFVGGLEGTFFQMIPLRYLDGHKIWVWNKLAWALVAGAAAFMFWDVLLRDQSSSMSTVSHGTPAVAIVAMVICFVLSVSFYAFFRLRGPEEALEAVEA
jgi:hypothetical protein